MERVCYLCGTTTKEFIKIGFKPYCPLCQKELLDKKLIKNVK